MLFQIKCITSNFYTTYGSFPVLIVPNQSIPTTMKKLFSLLCIVAIIAVSNCSKIPENNDPVLGVWAKTELVSLDNEENMQREEWIFNDAFLGRYHSFENQDLTFYTDFSWSVENGVYTIEYNGTDIPGTKVMLMKADQPETLALQDGQHFATRQ